MKERLIKKTSLGAQYAASNWTGKDTSGVTPIDDFVLVLIDESVDVTAGGVMLPQEMQDRHKQAAETGVIVAAGEGAFKWSADRSKAYAGAKPVPGTRVYFGRYSGQIVVGKDLKEYRLMTDKCIGAIEIE